MTREVLIAGVGNVFLGDDAFGVEVVRRLAEESLPLGVSAVDFGTRALHLALELLDPLELLIVVDCARLGGAPGTLYLIDPERELKAAQPSLESTDAHAMDLGAVFANVQAWGGRVPRTRLVACEPESIAESIELSATVRRAVAPAVRRIRELIDEEYEHRVQEKQG